MCIYNMYIYYSIYMYRDIYHGHISQGRGVAHARRHISATHALGPGTLCMAETVEGTTVFAQLLFQQNMATLNKRCQMMFDDL